MTHLDLAYGFLDGERYDGRCGNVSFVGNEFRSYRTAIALRVCDDRRSVLLVTDSAMTPTTAKHRYFLLQAAHDLRFNVIYVPFIFGKMDVTVQDIFKRWLSHLKYLANCRLTRKENAEEFCKGIDECRLFLDVFGFEDIIPKEYKALREELRDDFEGYKKRVLSAERKEKKNA